VAEEYGKGEQHAGDQAILRQVPASRRKWDKNGLANIAGEH
jgi:hypothetical protein